MMMFWLSCAFRELGLGDMGRPPTISPFPTTPPLEVGLLERIWDEGVEV